MANDQTNRTRSANDYCTFVASTEWGTCAFERNICFNRRWECCKYHTLWHFVVQIIHINMEIKWKDHQNMAAEKGIKSSPTIRSPLFLYFKNARGYLLPYRRTSWKISSNASKKQKCSRTDFRTLPHPLLIICFFVSQTHVPLGGGKKPNINEVKRQEY